MNRLTLLCAATPPCHDMTTQLPAAGGFPATVQPYRVVATSAGRPIVFYSDGRVNPLRRATPATGCLYGVNPATGYCFLTNQSLSYELQLASLPGPPVDPKKPFNATTNPRTCSCHECGAPESWSHLSVLGSLTALVCTYVGFGLLTVAVGWNASLLKKLKRIPQQWAELRGASRR